MLPKLGILAGGGDLPRRLIALCRNTGRDYFVVAFSGQADAGLVPDTPHEWIALGAGGQTVAALHREDVAEGNLYRKLNHNSRTFSAVLFWEAESYDTWMLGGKYLIS